MKRIPAFITLTIITLIAAVLLAVTDNVTRGPIEAASLAETDSARTAVLPLADAFSELEAPEGIDSLFEGLAGGQTVGHTATVTVQGFAGPVEVTVGMDTGGLLTGLSVGGSAFAETAGLGSLAKEPAFTDQFIGKSSPVTLGDGVDAISGATITSRAVADAVNAAARAIGFDVGAEAETDRPEPDQADQNEPDRADPRKEVLPAAETFVDKSPRERIEALYEAQAAGRAVGRVAVVTSKGFAGPVEVTIGVDMNNTLTGIRVGGSGFTETPGLGTKAQEPAFTDQFVGKTGPLAIGSGIDAVSGATVTSQAVLDAVNAGLAALGANEGPVGEASLSELEPTPVPEASLEEPIFPEPDQADQKEPGTAKEVFPAAEAFVDQPAPEGVDALYEAQAGGKTLGHVAVVTVQGYAGPVEVTVGMDMNNVLTGIRVGGSNFAETPGLGTRTQEPAFTDQFVGKTVPVAVGDDIDAVSGATITSKAVQNAVNTAAKAMGADIEFTLADTTSSATH